VERGAEMKIGVIGGGSWGTAISKNLSLNGHDVCIWTIEEKVFESFKWNENPYYLPGIKLPKNINCSMDIDFVQKDADILVFALPTQVIREVIKQIKNKSAIYVNLSKGLEISTVKQINKIFYEEFPDCKYCTLSGPSHAEEVSKNIPTSIVAASYDVRIANKIQKVFSGNNLRIYTNTDLNGIEICGALKNIYAIGAGIIDGLGPWDNTKAALITRSLVEMVRIGSLFGAMKETFMGLAGIGDLIVTCNSVHSRNRFVGEKIGLGKKLDEILNNMNMVAEGIYTAKAIYNFSDKNDVEVPIAKAIYDVLYNNSDPEKSIKKLMERSLKKEFNW
jgi:glycerol-3-phosphate dehydrogenase (NAD(P)+)